MKKPAGLSLNGRYLTYTAGDIPKPRVICLLF